jgi:hypothetical protein
MGPVLFGLVVVLRPVPTGFTAKFSDLTKIRLCIVHVHLINLLIVRRKQTAPPPHVYSEGGVLGSHAAILH